MNTTINIDNKHRAVVLEIEDIDPADFEDAVMKIFACAVRIDAATPIDVCEDSAMNADNLETESEE